MTALTMKHSLPRNRVTEITCIPLRLTAIITGFLLTMMPLLTGCGGGGGGWSDGSAPAQAAVTGITTSLAWDPSPSVYGYFVHYGRQSSGQSGSCSYESSMYVASPEATLTNLEPNTRYYFTVSAYNGLESPCSGEVSTVTPPPSGPPSSDNSPSDNPPSVFHNTD
jgi:hypothetical protein